MLIKILLQVSRKFDVAQKEVPPKSDRFRGWSAPCLGVQWSGFFLRGMVRVFGSSMVRVSPHDFPVYLSVVSLDFSEIVIIM